MPTNLSDQTREREQRLDDVVGGYLQALAAGRGPDPHELLARHPDLAPDLAQFLADLDAVGRLAAPLRKLQETPPPLGGPARRPPRPWTARPGTPTPLGGAGPRAAGRGTSNPRCWAITSCWRRSAGGAWGWCTRPATAPSAAWPRSRCSGPTPGPARRRGPAS